MNEETGVQSLGLEQVDPDSVCQHFYKTIRDKFGTEQNVADIAYDQLTVSANKTIEDALMRIDFDWEELAGVSSKMIPHLRYLHLMPVAFFKQDPTEALAIISRLCPIAGLKMYSADLIYPSSDPYPGYQLTEQQTRMIREINDLCKTHIWVIPFYPRGIPLPEDIDPLSSSKSARYAIYHAFGNIPSGAFGGVKVPTHYWNVYAHGVSLGGLYRVSLSTGYMASLGWAAGGSLFKDFRPVCRPSMTQAPRSVEIAMNETILGVIAQRNNELMEVL